MSKELKKIDREIWWLEVKIGWLRFVSGKSVSEPLMYFLIIAPLFFVYLIFDKYLISKVLEEKLLRWVIVIVLILLSFYLMYILDKIVSRRVMFLEKKLNFLYKQRSKLT